MIRYHLSEINVEEDVYEDSFLAFIHVRQAVRHYTFEVSREFAFTRQGKDFLLQNCRHGFTIYYDRPFTTVRIHEEALEEFKELVDILNGVNEMEWVEEYTEGQDYRITPL